MVLTSLTRYRDVGLLILRVGVGAMMMTHGVPKLIAGPDLWAKVGASAQMPFAPTAFGFVAGLCEALGGLLLALGLLTRVAAIMLIGVMVGAINAHMHLPPDKGGTFDAASHAITLLIVFISFLLMGPGPYSIDRK